MATASGDTWTRNPLADENPDLIRKRQRLSEDTETQRSPLSGSGSPIVEALPPDESGTGFHNAIELHDDADMASNPYTHGFKLEPEVQYTPIEQLRIVLETLLHSHSIVPDYFIRLSLWLREHLEKSKDEALATWQENYSGDVDFFSKLADLSVNILSHGGEVFRHVPDAVLDRLGACIISFLNDMAILGTRIILILPVAIARALSRKDSGQVKSPQMIQLLRYTQVLAQILALHGVQLNQFKDTFHLNPGGTATYQKRQFLQNPLAMPALTHVLQQLGDRYSEIDGAWDGLDAILRVLGALCSTDGMDAINDVDRAMATIHLRLLPAICVMSPRAIPIDVHEVLIKTACRLLDRLVQRATLDESAALYERYIQNDSDALLTEMTEGPTAASLEILSNGDADTLLGLLRTAWNLQALKVYIFSNIMDVRSSGILQLSTLLLQLYNTLKTSAQGFEHPILQYVGRFMRANELTKYIFGPDSHASLISHSQNIIGFLAATCLYTNNETDLIWAACTTSVEAEFVKASFGVLTELCRYLDLDQLLYLVKKYAITPPDKLGKDAVETLADLFQKVQLQSGSAKDLERRLTTALISTEILFKVKVAKETSAMSQLRDTARIELLRFATSEYDSDDRIQIYKHCIPNLLDPNDRATTTIEILLLFLDSATVCMYDAQYLLDMISVDTLVDELSHYVGTWRTNSSQGVEAHVSAIQSRMEAIIRLQALPEASRSYFTWATFSKCTIGDLAINNATRDCAWKMLSVMDRYTDDVGTVAKDMLRYCLEAAITQPLDYLTPTLLGIFGSELRQSSQGQDFEDNYSLVLQSPIWQKLVWTAESTTFPEASGQARKIVGDVLFEYPRAYLDKFRVARCHAEFAQEQIKCICETYQAPTHPTCDTRRQDIIQKIDLLAEVFHRSRMSGSAFEVQPDSDVVLAMEPAVDCFCREMYVYGGGHVQPKLYWLHATPSTTLSELAAKLPKITGTDTHRVIIGGKALDLEVQGNQQMSQLGIGPSTGVIMISPKHTFQSNIEILLTPAGEVEKEVLAQYDELEKLLDGPEDVAQKMFTFITEIRPPARQRQKVADVAQSAHDLFPPDKTWRSAFSIHVLRTHLSDYIRLGVVDEGFRLHALELLIGILTDKARPIEHVVFRRALTCLLLFLREQPSPSTIATIIKSPEGFVSRMIEICSHFLRSSAEGAMVELAFKALIESSERQPSVWRCFTENARVVDIHHQVFMHSDMNLASNITTMIRNFCADPTSAEDANDFYMKMGFEILPHALEHRTLSQHFLALTTDTLLANRVIRNDESQSRELCQVLVSRLQNYEHSESVDLPLADMTMAGLLELLNAAITVLQTFKKPLDLGALAVQTFTALLFPPLKDSRSRPLVNRNTRSLAYGIVRSTCESQAEFSCLLAATSLPMRDTPSSAAGVFPGSSVWQRPASQCSGLTNLGMTCYMNSLLQQLFANVHFRKFIFDTPIKDLAKQELLFQVQILFARMQNDYNPVGDTADLARVLGIQTDSQEDVHGFYEDFLSKLEASMSDDLSRKALSRFFSGTLISQIKGECGHVSPKTEPFVDLQMIVKNKATLLDSLQEFVQGEPMEGTNKYKCLSCDPIDGEGRLVNAMRRSCPENLPDNLTFCLKRFSFEAMYGFESKVNDRFEFPQTIDMSRWLRTHLDDPKANVREDLFELVGVIVHQGSLQLGHYWSYTLLRNTGCSKARTWIKLEDRMASTCQGGIEEVQQECFGGLRNDGQERADNAYVLFYQRKVTLEEQISLPGPTQDPSALSLLPSRVSIPAELQAAIHDANDWRTRITNVFNEDFHRHVLWMLSKYDHFAPRSPPQSDCDSPMEENDHPSGPDASLVEAANDFRQQISEVALAYLQRVAACDSAAAFRLDRCIATFKALMAAHPRFGFCVLDQIAHNTAWFTEIITHSNHKVRVRVLELVLACLAVVRDRDEAFYKEVFDKIKTAHAEVKETCDPLYFNWDHYLFFAVSMSQIGTWEAASVLDSGYLVWAFNTLYTLVIPERQKSFPKLVSFMHNNPLKVATLYDFIRTMMSENIVIPNQDDFDDISDSRHQITAGGIVLKANEIDLLTRGHGEPLWMKCAKFAECGCDWKAFAPGKFMALLMSPRHPYKLTEFVSGAFERHIRREDTVLDSVLHLLLHFCTCSSEEQATAAFHALAKTIHQWSRAELSFLRVVREAHHSTPLSVVSSIEHWAARYLEAKNGAVRQGTEKWLREAVFQPEPISECPELDTSRVRQVRTLARVCRPVVKLAYGREYSRTKYESMISTLLDAEVYLKKLQAAGKVAGQSSDEVTRSSISKPLSFELMELQLELQELSVFRKLVEEWEVEEPLPVSRRSVELESEEETTESDIYDDDDDGSVSSR